MTDGTIEKRDGGYIFRYERDLRHPIERVWQALTDPNEIASWTGNRPDIELRPGGQFVTHHGAGMTVIDRVERIEPPRLFEHTFWHDVNPSALVTWELSTAAPGCHLTLTHRLSLADIEAAANSIAKGDSAAVIITRNAAGWHQLLDKFEASLDGRDRLWTDEERQNLQERYAAMLN